MNSNYGFEFFDVLEANDKYIYHYTTFEVGLKYILPDLKLRLSPFTKVNDPRESKSLMLKIPDIDDYVGKADCLEEATDISLYLKSFQEKHKVLCFARDSQQIFDIPEQFRRIYRGYNKPTLWAHYADNHKGICLILDKDKVLKSVEKTFGGEKLYKVYKEHIVQYTLLEEIIEKLSINLEECFRIGIKLCLDSFVENNTSTLLFSKAIDWKVENEFRVVVQSEDTDYEYLYLPIDGSICGIVMGADAPYIHNLKIDERNILLNLKVPCGRLGWFNGIPYIRFVEC